MRTNFGPAASTSKIDIDGSMTADEILNRQKNIKLDGGMAIGHGYIKPGLVLFDSSYEKIHNTIGNNQLGGLKIANEGTRKSIVTLRLAQKLTLRLVLRLAQKLTLRLVLRLAQKPTLRLVLRLAQKLTLSLVLRLAQKLTLRLVLRLAQKLTLRLVLRLAQTLTLRLVLRLAQTLTLRLMQRLAQS